MCYNLHYESMRKMQSTKARNSVLPSSEQKGVQALQEQTHRQDESPVPRRTQGASATTLLSRAIVSVSEVSLPQAGHRFPVARPYQWKGRTWARNTQTALPVDKERGLSCGLPSPLLQPQPRKVRERCLSPRNAIVPHVAAEVMRCMIVE